MAKHDYVKTKFVLFHVKHTLRRGRCTSIVLNILDPDARRGWMLNVTLGPFYRRE
jgi:hypothetical protein